jgi:cytochrome c oxidase subunit 3
MWLFLFTEVFLFGALFLAFAIYLYLYRVDFMDASHHLNKWLGATNTLILLTSSLTMALGIAALERGAKRLSIAFQSVTVLAAFAFMAIKAREWGDKFAHDLYPNSATMLDKAYGEQVFYGFYFSMTGLHALHVIIGAAAVCTGIYYVAKEKIRPGRMVMLENIGLYWHLVDVVWIFLFPLFYLIGR